MHRFPLRSPFIEQVEELPRHEGAWVRLLKRPALAHDVDRGVRAFDALEPRGLPPCLDILDLLLEESVLSFASLLRLRQQLIRVGGQRSRDWRLDWREG